jgi:hypothetical protein
MTHGTLPETVAALIARHIHSPAQLEALLALYLKPEEWWTAGRLASEMRVPAWAAQERLEDLATRGFFAVKTADDVAFRFSPASEEIAAAVADLAAVYFQRPATVIAHVRASAPDPVRAFADAFRIKKTEDEDG